MPEIIKFDDPVVLIGGADVDEDLLRRYAHLPIVAADGGVNHLRETSLLPQVVVGDLDSLQDREYWQSVSRVIEIKEQDSTDFEKCLYSIDAPYFIAIGFSGNRIDHTLAALHVMQKLHLHKRVVLASEDDVVCVCSESAELSLPVGTRVSVYPLNRISFESSAGLRYPLDDLEMQPGVMIGTSNSSSKPNVSIVPRRETDRKPNGQKSCYALILPSDSLQSMVDMLVQLSRQVPAI